MSKKEASKDVEKGKTEGGEVSTEPTPDLPAPSDSVVRGSKRMQQTQAQVDEVTNIMRMNVEKVLERDAMISQLDERADALKEGAEMFEKQAGALKSKFWWENMKMMIVMGVVGLIFVTVIYMKFFG